MEQIIDKNNEKINEERLVPGEKIINDIIDDINTINSYEWENHSDHSQHSDSGPK